jgi:nucleotide-binding universal stress UspA family protein
VVLLNVIEPIRLSYVKALQSDAPATVKMYAKNYLAKASGSLKKAGIAAETAIVHGIPADEILDYATKNGVDLIIMSTHGRSGVSRWAFGSVADRVLRHSTAPVLIVPPRGCRTTK